MLRLYFVPLSMTADGRLQLLAPLHCLLVEMVTLQAVDEGAEGTEGAQLFVAGERTVAGVELAEDVSEHQRLSQTGIADVAQGALKGMDGFTVDSYFDTE